MPICAGFHAIVSFLVLFVFFALTPLDSVTNIRFLFPDELTKEFNEKGVGG